HKIRSLKSRFMEITMLKQQFTQKIFSALILAAMLAGTFGTQSAKAFDLIPAPTNVDASTNSFDNITVTWDASSTLLTKIFRSTESDGSANYFLKATLPVDTSSLVDTTVDKGRLYYYFVQYCTVLYNICSPFTESGFGIRGMETPGNLAATDGDFSTSIMISWDAVDSAVFYRVVRSDDGFGYFYVDEVNAISYLDDDLNLETGKLYYYHVLACSAWEVCSFVPTTDTGYLTLAVPTNIDATAYTHLDKIVVTWTAAAHASYYEVYRAIYEGNDNWGSYLKIADSGTTTYNDTTAETGVYYAYGLKSCRDYGCSEFNTSGDAGGARKLPTPTGLSATDNTHPGKVVVTWDVAEWATTYHIFRQVGGVGGYISTDTTLTTPIYNDLNTVSGVSYSYKIRSCVSFACSDFGAVDSGFRDSRIFADGFETGNFSKWSNKAGTIVINGASALDGTRGARVKVFNKKPKYVLTNTPVNETRYRAGLYLDINSLTMRDKNNFTLMQGRKGTIVTFSLQVRKRLAKYQIRAIIRTDGGSNVNTAWRTLPNKPVFVSVDRRAAASAGNKNGYIKLFINGVQKVQKTGINNDTLKVAQVRLGVVTKIKAAHKISGTFLIDGFASDRFDQVEP
ncbi:MAG: hypothetical protein N2D54_12015, partial [Chloroflexota bacterium]